MSQPKIDDLLKDPDFQSLGKDDQDNLKAEFFQTHVEKDQEFQSLSDPDKQVFLKDFLAYGSKNQNLPEDVRPKTFDFGPALKTASEIGKGTVRGFEGIAAGVGGTMKWIGDNLSDQTPTKFKTTSGQEIEIAKNPNSIGAKIGRKLQEYGETAHDFWIKEASQGAASPDPELFRGSFMENPSFTRAASLIAEAVPSLAYATAITFATKNPMAGAAALGLIQGSDDYLEARKAGKSLGKSNAIGGLSAAGTAILEDLPLTGFLNRASKKAASGVIGRSIEIAKDAFAGAVQEGSEEAAQQLWTNLVAKLGYDKTRKLAEGMVESIIAGAGSGGLIGGFTSGKGLETDLDIEDAKEKGITEEQLDAAKNHLFNQMMNHADVIEGILSKSAKKTSDSVKQITQRERKLLPADAQTPAIEITQEDEGAAKPDLPAIKEEIKKQVLDLSDAGELPQALSPDETPMSIILREIMGEINAGQAGRRFATETEDGEKVGGSEGSTFPDYFKNKGYTKAETVRIINKALSAKPLTPRQIAVLEDLIQGKIDAVKKEIEYYERLAKEQGFEEDAGTQEEKTGDLGASESGPSSQEIIPEEDVLGEGSISVESESSPPEPVASLPDFEDFDSLDEWVLSRADAYGGMNSYKKTEEYKALKPQIEKRINDLALSKSKDPLYVQPEMPNKPLRPNKDQNEVDLMGEKERAVKEAEKRQKDLFGDYASEPEHPYLPATPEGGTLKGEAEVAYENKEDQEKSLQKIISEIQDKHTAQNIRRAGIVRDLQEVKFVNFSGRKISGPDDLAQLHQVFRSPAVETFVYYIIKSDGTIFTNKAISSGMVDQAIIPEDINDRIYVDLMAAGKDAQLIVAHNHPSGRTNASQEDMVLTQRVKRAFPQAFKGHLIIDHNEYLWIDDELGQSIRDFKIESESGKWRDDVKRSVRDPDSLAVFFSDVLRGKRNLHIPFLDKGNGIIAYEIMNPFSLGSELFKSIIEAKKRYAATAYVLMGDQETIRKIKEGGSNGGVFPQGILDILTVESESGAISDKSVGVEIKTTRNTSVMEPESEYAQNARQSGVENPDLVARLSKKIGGLEYIKAVESPELVKLVKALSGENVQLNSRFIESLGRFMHIDGPGGRGWVELSKHIFKDPKLAQGILAHEIGHLFDWLPDETLKRGNILGRIGSLLDYRKSLLPRTPEESASMLSDKDRARIRREAEKIARGAKSGEESKDQSEPSNQFDPDLILGIWNSVEQSGIPPILMNYVKGLSADGKKSIVKSALEAKKEWKPVTIEDIKDMNSAYFKDPQGVYEIYKDLLKKEILKRKLYEEEVIREELKNLTRWWHPFDEASQTNPLTGQQSSYVKYRFSSRELYAEFISVLLNAPAKAKQMAPTAYEAFWNHIGEKEEVLDALLKTQSLIQGDNDELLRQRESDIKGMFEKSEQMFRARQLRYEKARKSIWFMVKNAFWDKNNSILDLRGPASKTSIIDPGIDPKYILEKREFVSAAVRSYLEKLEPVYKQISEKKLKSDISLYIFAKRIMGDRAELANPLGHNPKTAGEQLEFLKKQKPEQFAEVERLFGDIQGWFKSEIVPLMKDVYTPDQIKKASESDVYAPFRVIDFMKDYVSSGMMPQEGTLRDVGDLFTALVMKSASMISAASKNDIKKRMGNFLLQNPSLSSMQAAKITQYPGVFKIENAPDKTMGTVSWREDGKWRAYHVEKWVADSFNGDNNNFFVLNGMLEKLSGSQLARPMWITFNLSFQAANLFRDFFRAWKAHPKMTLGAVLENYAKAFPHAVAKVKGQYDALTNEMQRNGVIGFTLNDLILNESAEDQELEKFLERYDIIAKKESKIKNIPGIKQISDFLDGIRFVGDIIETVPKVAGYTALSSLPQERREYITRNLIGTPNYKRGGSLKQIYNPIFIFSNVIKEGWRGAIEMSIQDKELRGQYWKKTAALNLMSKLFIAAMLYGLFGSDKEERDKFKQMAEKMTEYDKTNSIVVPLGINSKGEANYLRIPQDEDGRFIGALFWKMITNAADPEAMLKEIFSLTANQIPQTAPAFKIAGGWTEFLRGISPRDDWRGREIVSRDQMAAGGWSAIEPMILWTLSNTGFASFTSYDRLKDQGMRKTVLALTPIINRFYRETNYGEQERYYKAASKIQKSEAQKRLSVYDKAESLRGKGVTPYEARATEGNKKDAKKIQSRMSKLENKASDDPLIRALGRAGSNEQKRAMFKAAFDEFKDAKDLRAYLSQVARLKLISGELAGNIMRDFSSRSD